jgi:CBS domain containing-hemolysin-like protein
MKSLSLSLITSLLIALTAAIPLNEASDSLLQRSQLEQLAKREANAKANIIRLAEALEERDMAAAALEQVDETGVHGHGMGLP